MPRYKKSYDGERRTRRRIILLTPGENRQLEKSAEAAGAQFSEHVRELCLRRSMAGVVAGTSRNPQARALVRELTAIGNNLNELARVANATRAMPQLDELHLTTDQLKAAFERCAPAFGRHRGMSGARVSSRISVRATGLRRPTKSGCI
jgi:Bacterial mobilisation protein (MobC)